METSADIYYHGPVVALDLDDTLFSEREHAVAAYEAVAACAGPDRLPGASRIMAAALDNRENPFTALDNELKAAGIESATNVDTWLREYRSFAPAKLSLYSDAAALLAALRKAGVRMALITDGRSHTQRAKIKALGIADFFHPADIHISEERGHDKREPDNFIAVVHHYPEASKFIYIGDNAAKDFEMPSLLGWDCYRLRCRPGNIHPDADSPDATAIDSLTDILPLLLS